jgi:hypothetical protein
VSPFSQHEANGQAVKTWATWRDAVGVVRYRTHLRATSRIALIVGTVLFAINQLDVVVAGQATAVTWVKSAVTYLVPFVVANLGVLTATRRRAVDPRGSDGRGGEARNDERPGNNLGPTPGTNTG